MLICKLADVFLTQMKKYKRDWYTVNDLLLSLRMLSIFGYSLQRITVFCSI